MNNIGWAKNEIPIPNYDKLPESDRLANSQWQNTEMSINKNRALNAFDLKLYEVNRRDTGVYSCSTIGASGRPIRCEYELKISCK